MAVEAVCPDVLSSPLAKPVSGVGAIQKLLAVLLCGLAFLLACTPARNSDLWLHLASGRWLSARYLPDGTDPFSSTTEGVYWVNHTWLSDILLYQIFNLGDGLALIVTKGILVAVLALLLLCFRRQGEGLSIPMVIGFVAILALGPWLVLQPGLFSLLGVLLTLYLLERPSLLDGVAAERARARRWLLIPLFVLWANLDGWFVLGPILVGLHTLGSAIRTPRIRRSESGNSLADSGLLLTLATVAACLATPYHYHIFTWPTPLGLTAAEQTLRQDPLGQTLVLSPFADRFVASPFFRSPGIWAYYMLLAASAFSFVLSIRTLHPGRLLVWLALAALSVYQAYTIPFFVMAAAPILALNLQDSCGRLARRIKPALAKRLSYTAGRMGVLIGIVLLVLAWPGWLQVAPYQARGWSVEPNGSLVRMASQLKRWHAESFFRPDRFALTFSPETAHYLAWFCPEEKSFVDSRWPLFDRVAGDYVQMRRVLLKQDGGGDQELISLLDAHWIDRILLYDTEWERMARAYRHLFLAPEWELLAVEGGATLFRRKGGTAPSPEAFDYRRAAYHPVRDECVPPPTRPAQPPHWFDAFRRHPDSGSADREEAALHLLRFDLQGRALAIQWLLVQDIGLIGCRPGLEMAARIPFHSPLQPYPSEPLLLALRAARRALAVNPDDAHACLILAECYVRLERDTRELRWEAMLPDLPRLRQTQKLTALEQAVLLRPDLARAHELLARLYHKSGQMDRCLEHLRACLRSAEKTGQYTEEPIADLQVKLEEVQKVVTKGERAYQANLTGRTNPSKVLERAELAARFGLSRLALEMLQESFPAIYGRPGIEYQLDLMRQAGLSYQILDVLTPEIEFKIANYHWLKACAAAGCGDYATADAELDKDAESVRRVGLTAKLVVPVRWGTALHVARAILNRSPEIEGIAGRVTAIRFQVESMEAVGKASGLLRKEADRQVLRGLLALEAGMVEAAKQHFRTALNLWGNETEAQTGAGLDFPTRPIAEAMLRSIRE